MGGTKRVAHITQKRQDIGGLSQSNGSDFTHTPDFIFVTTSNFIRSTKLENDEIRKRLWLMHIPVLKLELCSSKEIISESRECGTVQLLCVLCPLLIERWLH